MSTVDYRVLDIKLKRYVEKRDEFEKEIREFITNHHFLIDERWNLLIHSDFGKVGWYHEFKSLEVLFGRPVDWVKDFGLQRHCIIAVEDIYAKLLKKGYTEKQLEPFKNEVTVNYIRSFKHDW